MAYLVLARKYRPQKFEDLIGQEPIAKTLKNALSSGKTAHAYLFSGPRGVGKTTTARIFAKALNCQKGPTQEPCGECQNCKEITRGSSLDVLEIDGASNRGIDDIRALRENVKFTPANSKYKIYIIDEAHQITTDAFNALLKTLEEPPPHVIFMLATTEPQRIPLTILSRCQRYRFRMIPFDNIFRYLSKIAQCEGFKIADDALNLMVKAAAGSLRDGLSVMDQIASFSGDEIKIQDVQYVLGYLPRELMDAFLEALVNRNTKSALEQVGVVSEGGYDLYQFGSDLREYFRKLLIVASGNEPQDESQENIASLKALSKKFGMPGLIRNMRLLSRCLDEMKWSEHQRLVLELYTVRLAESYVDLKELAAQLGSLPSEQTVENIISEPPSPPFNAQGETEKKIVNTNKTQNENHNESDVDWWEAVLREIEKTKPSLNVCLKEVYPSDGKNNTVKLIFARRYSSEFVSRNQEYIEKIIQKISKKNVRITVELDESRASHHGTEETVKTSVCETVRNGYNNSPEEIEAEEIHHPEDDPGVKKVLEVFPGKIIF